MMMRMFAGWRAVGLAAALVAACHAFGQTLTPAENVIHVEISGLRNDKGQVLCALFSSADAFPKKADKAVARLTVKIAERQATCDFSGVAAGTYAVSVVHDENSNCKLDTNFIGVPREGVGALELVGLIGSEHRLQPMLLALDHFHSSGLATKPALTGFLSIYV